MGNLAQDTAVFGEAGHYRAALSPDWEIWGPNGGYVAAVALRAAGAHSRHTRPASVLCHFLGVADFAEVHIDVHTIRESSKAHSMRVSMSQGTRPILEALVWTVNEDLDGLIHEAAPAPLVPGPDALPSIDDRVAALPPTDRARMPRFSFFSNLDEHPVDWVEHWNERPAGDPVHRCWYRFRPTATFGDSWVDAGRLLITIDTFQWPAAVRAHAGGSLRHIAPSIDLACRFHRMAEAKHADWLLVEARSPVAWEGLVAGTASVWDRTGRLLASGGQQMLCRAAPEGFT